MSTKPSRGRLGYEPALDGLRAVAVVAVILYHVHSLDALRLKRVAGGFFGVELFFVVSGYLITSLLLQEHASTGRIDLRQFWIRRARRLLPALAAMLVAVGVWASLWRPDTLGGLRHDVLPAIFYISNWWQIFSGDSGGYFAQLSTPPLLRHLWSLAVEEQWYLLWPLIVRALVGRRRLGALLAIAGLAAALIGVVTYRTGSQSSANFVYLSTITRASGLLLGSALAVVWRPWRSATANQRSLPVLDAAALAALAVLIFAVTRWSNTSTVVYRGGMLVVSVASLVLIAAAVHPGAHLTRRVFGSVALAAVGRRSYGMYLWHWPILVLTDATRSTSRLLVSLALTVVVAEACFRLVEEPVRRGALGRWWASQPSGSFDKIGYSVAALALLVPLTIRIAGASTSSVVVGGQAAAFELATTPSTIAAVDASATSPTATAAATLGPVRVVVVGDSQAESLVKNLPSGIESIFSITDGSVPGCGVWDDGSIWSSFENYRRANGGCAGWPAKWQVSAKNAQADVALVMVGAWDVFDVAYNEGVAAFASASWDAKFTASLQKGITVLSGAGAKVALLEVPCMNPVRAKGAAVPPLPERGEPWRTGHVNDLLRRIAAADPAHVSFVPGPREWCNDAAIRTSLDYRWDGVHVYRPGAKLILESIAPSLLSIAGR